MNMPDNRSEARELTIPPKRLIGSPECLNCGTTLQGPFCFYCGQPDKNIVRFFPALVRDMMEDFIDFDSRFMRTIKPLLLHPGRLTRDYLVGRRFRYTPPMRLYIFSSMFFFILAAMLAGSAIDVSMSEGKGIHITFDGDENTSVARELEKAVAEGELTETEAERVNRVLDQALPEETAGEGESAGSDDVISFNDKPWDPETNPLLIPGMPDFVDDWINKEIGESPQKGREIESNPNLIVDQMFDVLPIAVFVMLPLVALLFKAWYLFSGRYYVEHLIHALHNHAFLFVVFTLMLLSSSLALWLDPEASKWIGRAAEWVDIILLCWIPVYLLISLKVVYQQGWSMTLFKYSVIGVCYFSLLLCVTSIAAIFSFFML